MRLPPREWALLTGALLLLYWAWHLKHPLMSAIRMQETPMLLTAACLGVWNGLRYRLATARPIVNWLCVAAFAAVLAITAIQEGRFEWQRYRVLQGSPLMQLLGHHFVVGYRDVESIAPLAEKGLIAGVYLTHRNIAGRTLAAVQAEIAYLQSLRSANGLPPLFVAADQEGGTVNHLAPLLPERPALATLARLKPEARAKAAYAYGELHGRDLASVGVNLNLSPVVDLKPRRHGWWVDTHTLIHRRAISSDADTVRQIATAYTAGLQTQGVQATLKHFPGLGPVQADTHLTPARLGLGMEKLKRELAPFTQISRQTGSAIMVAHVTIDALDPKRPASQSRLVIDGWLRKEAQHQGLVLTDDLNMGAVYRLGIGRSATASLNAGADLVLITYDPDQFYRALYETMESYRHGAIDDRRLLASRERMAQHWRDGTARRPPARLASVGG